MHIIASDLSKKKNHQISYTYTAKMFALAQHTTTCRLCFSLLLTRTYTASHTLSSMPDLLYKQGDCHVCTAEPKLSKNIGLTAHMHAYTHNIVKSAKMLLDDSGVLDLWHTRQNCFP